MVASSKAKKKKPEGKNRGIKYRIKGKKKGIHKSEVERDSGGTSKPLPSRRRRNKAFSVLR